MQSNLEQDLDVQETAELFAYNIYGFTFTFLVLITAQQLTFKHFGH